MNLRRYIQKLMPTRVSDQQIIDGISSWMLSCAVGVSRGEWVQSSLTFDLWFQCCETTWVPEVAKKSGATPCQIKSALERFVIQNRNKTSDLVLREVSERRGEPVGITLNPGESRSIEIKAELGEPIGGPLSEEMCCQKCGVILLGDGALENHRCKVFGGSK